jgi:hypothetical protein
MEYTLNLAAITDIGGTSPEPLPKMQGIVSDIPTPTESRKERLARQKKEAEDAKLQAKTMKNVPITKKKVTLTGDDQMVTITPEKDVPTVINVPGIWKRTKKWFKENKGLATAFGIVLAIVLFGIALMFANNAWQNSLPKSSNVPKTVEEVKITKNPVATETPKKVPGVPAVNNTPTEKPAQATATTPTPPPTSNAQPVVAGSYIVEKHDTLWDIAVRVYGDGTRWKEIYERNKDILLSADSRNANSPGHWIHAGTALQLE